MVEPSQNKGPSELVILIRHILEAENLSRQELATRETLDPARLDAILDRYVEPTAKEYDAIARALNRIQYRGPQWDRETLREFYQRKNSELNGDPKDNG